MLLVAVTAVALAGALWLPSRNDTASATEHGATAAQAHDQHRHGWWNRWNRRHDREHRHDRRDRSGSPGDPSPIDSPAAEPPSSPPPSSPARSSEPVTTPPTGNAPDVTAWKPFTDYTAGQLVTFAGVEYQVRETHTSLPGWEPPKLPQLFRVV